MEKNEKPSKAPQESLASWLGINRATVAVMIVIGGLGLSEEIWRNFLAIHLKDTAGDTLKAVAYMGIYAFLVNLMEGFGYIIGGAVAHHMGPRAALAVSALPMAIGFSILLLTHVPWVIVCGALLITNWEPLSVPATFEVVGSEVPKNRRTIAFAVQSIQKRLPKAIGPLIGGLVMAAGYWVNLSLAFGLLALTVVLQSFLLKDMRPTEDSSPVPIRDVMKNMPEDLRALLTAEIMLRWGNWFVRDFAVIYVTASLGHSTADAGLLIALSSWAALLTYIPVGKMIDRAPSAKPYIGLTFLLFALFPFCLVLLPPLFQRFGLPVFAALVIAFVVNGLRELGEPARKSLITNGFSRDVRARAVGVYWGLRSFAFCPAPLIAAVLWQQAGPDVTFLIGGAIGLVGTAWFYWRVRCVPRPAGAG